MTSQVNFITVLHVCLLGPGGRIPEFNASITTPTPNATDAESFDERMTRYAFYYLYIAGGTLVAGYFQV